MSRAVPSCAALCHLSREGDWVTVRVCGRAGVPGKPLCQAHVAMLMVSEIEVLSDDGKVYVIGGCE